MFGEIEKKSKNKRNQQQHFLWYFNAYSVGILLCVVLFHLARALCTHRIHNAHAIYFNIPRISDLCWRKYEKLYPCNGFVGFIMVCVVFVLVGADANSLSPRFNYVKWMFSQCPNALLRASHSLSNERVIFHMK